MSSAESRVESRGSLIGRVEPIGDEDQRVRAHVRHRREFGLLVGERLAHVTGRDDRRAPSSLAHDEAGDRQALVETEVLHLARLADREQRVRAVGEIPFDQPFEAGVVDIAVIAERSEHHWDDTADGAWHALKSPVTREGRSRNEPTSAPRRSMPSRAAAASDPARAAERPQIPLASPRRAAGAVGRF